MPLGARDILLVIRARDAASREIQKVGASLATLNRNTGLTGGQMIGIGAAFAVAGAAGLAFFGKSTKAAIEYNRQAALTLTQTQGLGISLKQIEQVGLDVAKSISAPLDEMQESLYDIFSSMSIGEGATAVRNSKILLKDFAMAAVAGQVELQTAARATISIMNAYELEAKDVRKVNDFMFELVAKGVGTYDEFAKAIGRSIPSARRAGQTYHTLGGVMAFLTRNGQSAAMSATSAGRAMDSLTKGPVGERLDAMGISIRNAAGEFRQINDIATDLGKHFRSINATGPQMAATMEAIFKGAGGTIQARRFWDLAIKNFEQLNWLTKSVTTSTGALAKAYDTMAATPAQRIQALKNAWGAFSIEIGRVFIPIVMVAMSWMQKLIGVFMSLPAPIQKAIILLGAFTALVSTIAGVALIIAGLVKMSGAFTLLKAAIDTTLLRLAYLTGSNGLLSIPAVAGTVVKSLGQIGLAIAKSVGWIGLFVGAGLAIGKAFEWLNKNNTQKRITEIIGGSPKDHRDFIIKTDRIKNSIADINKELSKGPNRLTINQQHKLQQELGRQEEALSRVSGSLKHYNTVLDAVNKTTGVSEQVILSHARKLGLDLTNAGHDADFQIQKITTSINMFRASAAASGATTEEMTDKLAVAGEALNKFFASDEGKKVFDKFMEESMKGVMELSDVIAKFGNDAEVTGKKLDEFYKEQTKAIGNWNKNLVTALARGLDPQVLKDIAQKGPIEAGVLLEKLVSDKKGAMIEIVNEGHKSLSKIQLATQAINSTIIRAQVLGNQGMLKEAREAGRILELIYSDTGGKTAVKFIEEFEGGLTRFQFVADQFGIDWQAWFLSLPKEIQLKLQTVQVNTQKVEFKQIFIDWLASLPKNIGLTLDPSRALSSLQQIRQGIAATVLFAAGANVTPRGTPLPSAGQRNTPKGLFQYGGHITARQFGGPAFRRAAYLVGEIGPELFVPDQSGTIIPNWKLPGIMSMASRSGGGDMNVNLNVQVYESNNPAATRAAIEEALYNVGRRMDNRA